MTSSRIAFCFASLTLFVAVVDLAIESPLTDPMKSLVVDLLCSCFFHINLRSGNSVLSDPDEGVEVANAGVDDDGSFFVRRSSSTFPPLKSSFVNVGRVGNKSFKLPCVVDTSAVLVEGAFFVRRSSTTLPPLKSSFVNIGRFDDNANSFKPDAGAAAAPSSVCVGTEDDVDVMRRSSTTLPPLKSSLVNTGRFEIPAKSFKLTLLPL
mmetsp:Transcript_23918/g.47475  ORF Transcript_23918/g.47475 Transcript_23918/m.47475 type:complete len:208 (+) Transcript_23918:1071-1694(+)